GATSIIASGQGAMTAPTSEGVMPYWVWSRNGSVTKIVMEARNAVNAPMVESASTGRASKSTGRIGFSSPHWRRTNNTPRNKPAATTAQETTGLSPCTPLSMPPITSPKVTAHNSAPSTSYGSERRGMSGSARPNNKLSRANGNALANTHGQGATDSTRPPSVGASAAATDTTTAFTPMPRPSWAEG